MSKSQTGSKKKNRLSAEQRQEVLLTVAAEVFLEKGYEATNLDDIISRAGGSRRTIYTQFGGKEGLFKALVKQITDQALTPMRQAPDLEGDFRQSLRDHADTVLAALFMPPVMDLYRLALADGIRFPDLAEVYYSAGPGRASQNLTEFFKMAQASGEISCKDCELAASQFIGMMRDNIHLQVLLRLRPAPDQEEMSAMLENALDIFLYGITKRKP